MDWVHLAEDRGLCECGNGLVSIKCGEFLD